MDEMNRWGSGHSLVRYLSSLIFTSNVDCDIRPSSPTLDSWINGGRERIDDLFLEEVHDATVEFQFFLPSILALDEKAFKRVSKTSGVDATFSGWLCLGFVVNAEW